MELTAGPAEIFCRGRILFAEFSRAQLAQRLSELAISVVSGVLSGPPYVIAKLSALAQPPQFLNQDLQTDETVDSDLVTSSFCRS